MTTRITSIVASAAFSTTFLLLSAAAVGQNPFPEAPGRATVFMACSQCHSIGKMAQAQLTADDWQFVVFDMIARGAPVPEDEVDTVVRYLQDSFASDERGR